MALHVKIKTTRKEAEGSHGRTVADSWHWGLVHFSSSPTFWGRKLSACILRQGLTWLSQALNSWSSSCHLPDARIIAMHHHARLWNPLSEQGRDGNAKRAINGSAGWYERHPQEGVRRRGQTPQEMSPFLATGKYPIPGSSAPQRAWGSIQHMKRGKKKTPFLKIFSEKTMFCFGSLLTKVLDITQAAV